MTDETAPGAPERDDEDAVDLDLDADDVLLREAIGAPTTVRVNGKVLTIPHQKDWPHIASAFLGQGSFSAWARRVMSPQDFERFEAADLHNYQVEQIVRLISEAAGIPPGKRSPQSRSSARTRKR